MLLEENRGILLKTARIYCANSSDQDDLIQEILFQLWKSYPSFRSDCKFSTWMYRVALNTAITYFKRDQKYPTTNLANGITESIPQGQDKTKDQLSRLELFYRAAESLSEIEKAIIFLHIEGLSHKEMAETLGISDVNTRVKLNRIKKKIKAKIEGMGYDF
ncbi:MAG: sigma-70 family RNA polymerase sigma factor [Planctomycetota bacterium]